MDGTRIRDGVGQVSDGVVMGVVSEVSYTWVELQVTCDR